MSSARRRCAPCSSCARRASGATSRRFTSGRRGRALRVAGLDGGAAGGGRRARRGAWPEPPAPHPRAIVVPIPVEPSGPAAERDIAALTYAANPHKKGLDRVLAAWAAARRGGEELVVAGTAPGPPAPGVRWAGRL